MVDIRGKLSAMGTGVVTAVNPVGLTVESPGILKGYGDLVMASIIKTGHTDIIYNGPEKTFSVEVNSTQSPLEGLVSEKVFGTLVICAKKDDEFLFFGCGYKTTIIGLVDNHGELAIAYGLKHPKTRNDLTTHYFEYAPDDYMRERFSGIYINVASQIGVPKKDALGFDISVASAKLWFAYGYQGHLLLNFDENAYRLSLQGGVEMGIEACVVDICAGINASICLHVEGGYTKALGWNFGASASGGVSFGAGVNCTAGCNEIVGPPECAGAAFRVCATATADISFNGRDGLKFNARPGGTPTSCF
jgi:hypothetical protein